MRSYWSRMSTLIQHDWCSYKKMAMGRHRDTERASHEDGGRDWSNTSVVYRTPRIASYP